jgi:hypothetical protein
MVISPYALAILLCSVMKRLRFNSRGFRCPYQCGSLCKTPGGLTRHKSACAKNPANIYIPQTPPSESPQLASPRTPSPFHQELQDLFYTPSTPANHDHAPIPQSPHRIRWTVKGRLKIRTHPYLDGQSRVAQTLIVMTSNCSSCFIVLGQPCDEDGYDLPPDAPPPPFPERPQDNYYPYNSLAEFELADFLFRKDQMSANRIDELMEIWAIYEKARLGYNDDETVTPPFANTRDLYNVIDATELGDVPWQAFSVKYNGEIPPNAPNWMSTSYEVWFRDPLTVMEDQIGNRDVKNEMDYAPKQVFSAANKQQFSDFMSGDWVWNQAVSGCVIY